MNKSNYYELNKEKIKERVRKYREDNKDRIVEYEKNRCIKNKAKLSEYNKRKYIENREKVLERVKEYKRKNPELKKQQDRDYIKRNPHVARAAKANYKKSRKRATPKWLTKEHFGEIKEFHRLAIEKAKETGIEHHVDHIVPLQGKTVCGLHVPWNLRVITHTENRQKTNKLLETL